jgi:hypothetical protein
MDMYDHPIPQAGQLSRVLFLLVFSPFGPTALSVQAVASAATVTATATACNTDFEIFIARFVNVVWNLSKDEIQTHLVVTAVD